MKRITKLRICSFVILVIAGLYYYLCKERFVPAYYWIFVLFLAVFFLLEGLKAKESGEVYGGLSGTFTKKKDPRFYGINTRLNFWGAIIFFLVSVALFLFESGIYRFDFLLELEIWEL